MKAKKWTYRFLLGLLTLTFVTACVEEMDIETFGDDGVQKKLVVETVLTNELKTQIVYLSRSDSRLDLVTDTIFNPYLPLGLKPIDSVDTESGAFVRVTGNNGIVMDFTEGEDGTYLSNEPFALTMGVEYYLEITTMNGTEYVSNPLIVEGTSEITSVYAEKAISESGAEGIAIYVDSDPLQGGPEYYRYSYEETYKIVAPNWVPYDFELTDYDNSVFPPNYNLEIVEREVENQICYNTVESNTIEIYGTTGNQDRQISRHRIRFVGKDNFIISHRYSILVKQYVQSADAYSFYETLKSFSQSEGVFSQIQPGALIANVHRKDGSGEEVYGYAEAVSASEKRLFFNFEDFFPDEELPPYAFGYDCQFLTAQLYNAPPDPCPQGLLERIDAGIVSFYSVYDEALVPNASCPGPYVFVPRLCGDCTLLGENVKPDFWVD